MSLFPAAFHLSCVSIGWFGSSCGKGQEWEPHARRRQSTRVRRSAEIGNLFPGVESLFKRAWMHVCVCTCVYIGARLCAPCPVLCWPRWPRRASSRSRRQPRCPSSCCQSSGMKAQKLPPPSWFPQQRLRFLFFFLPKMTLPFKGFLICKLFPQFISLQ